MQCFKRLNSHCQLVKKIALLAQLMELVNSEVHSVCAVQCVYRWGWQEGVGPKCVVAAVIAWLHLVGLFFMDNCRASVLAVSKAACRWRLTTVLQGPLNLFELDFRVLLLLPLVTSCQLPWQQRWRATVSLRGLDFDVLVNDMIQVQRHYNH